MRVKPNPHGVVPLLAFILSEVIMAVGLFGLMVVSLYCGISTGFETLKVARESLRATQLALEKMETIRLYNWEQVNSNGFIPESFTASFHPGHSTSNGSGLVYYGTTTIAPANAHPAYDKNLREVTVTLVWTNGAIRRERQMSTFISEYGMQRYIVN